MRITLTVVLLLGLSVPTLAADKKAGPKSPPPGFTALFNGKDLSGWKNPEMQAQSWKVQDGALHYTGKGGRNLATAKNYKDFELWVDWKINKGGDSGIYLRGKPQVQIWDNKEGSGGLWNNPKGAPGKEPSVVADHKPGEWNTFYIKMVGDKVTVKLNGKTVVNNAVMLAGKVPPEGSIELQVHGNPLWFRNVFVREITPK
jgi:3-keto-disaccharide hydrolase